ncbi:MAG TPA: protein kinase [Gemmataceae bacterium]
MSQLPSVGRGRPPSLDTVVGRFNQLWLDGERPALDDYLTDLNADCRLAVLAELVHVEMEFRLKTGEPARVEEYLQRYPELDSPDVLLSLIATEHRMRQRREPSLAAGEYLERFPRHAEELGKRLNATIPTGINPLTADDKGRRPADLLPGEFSRYRILKQLGKGGMGAVYLVHDSQLDRAVAMKIPHYRPEDGTQARERFVIEARAAAALHHRNVCPVHDAGQINGVPYLTMAYIEGRPLSDLLRAEQPFTPSEAAALVRKLALALHEAHARGVIHRDLKPSNILIDKDNEPVLVDFGLARRMGAAETRLTHPGSLMGTPAYMSPEQANGDLAVMGPATDIYSLGMILYELLAGRPPFRGPAATVLGQIMSATPQPPSVYRPDLDPALETICLQAMAKNIEDRYPSMIALADALTAYLQGDRQDQIQQSDAAPSRSSGQEMMIADAGRSTAPALSFWHRRPAHVGAAAAFLFAALSLAAWTVIKINTAKGQLVIETDDPNIEVVVKQGGATIIDRTAQREIVLKPGGYEIELAEAKQGLQLSTKKFTLLRGERQIVRVYLETGKQEAANDPDRKDLRKAGPDQPKAEPVVKDFQEIHGADGQALEKWMDGLRNQWFRPVFLSVSAGAVPRFTAIAIRDGRYVPFRYFVAKEHGPEEWQRYWDQTMAAGFRSTLCCWHHVGGRRYASGLWVNDNENWAWQGGPIGRISERMKSARRESLRPIELNGVDPPETFNSTFVRNRENLDWDVYFDLTEEALRKLASERCVKGWRLDWVSCYLDHNQPRFLAIIVRDRGNPDWKFLMDMPTSSLEKELVEQKRLGLRPLAISAYEEKGETRYAAIWLRYRPAEPPPPALPK